MDDEAVKEAGMLRDLYHAKRTMTDLGKEDLRGRIL
jgi:hypothetical protein